MKALNYILICGLMALFAIKPLEASYNASKTLSNSDLIDYFENGVEIIDDKFCDEVKTMATKLLKADELQQLKSKSMKEFRNNLTDFLYHYDNYMRYRLSNVLRLRFDSIIREFNNSNNINKLLNKYGFQKIQHDYEEQYNEFIIQKFLPEFEEHIKHLKNWGDNLKKCPNYKCQSKHMDMLMFGNRTPRSDLLLYYRDHLNDIYIYVGNQEYDMAQRLLKSLKQSELNKGVKKELTKDLKKFIKKYEKHDSLKQLFYLIEEFGEDIIDAYYYNRTISQKDQKLISQIFNEQGGYEEFSDKYEAKILEFIHGGLFRKFQQFKAALNRKGREEEQDLLQWYDNLSKLPNIEYIKEEINKYYYD